MALARDRSDDIVRELKRKGYRIEAVSRTLLGRTRILATKNGGRREIIVNPVTGEILRDLWIARSRDDRGKDREWDDWDDNDRDDRDDDRDGDDDRGGREDGDDD